MNTQTSGPCAKQVVKCTLVHPDGRRWVGFNHVAFPQTTCPRGDLPSGVGYELCRSVCGQKGHAEEKVLRLAGEDADGCTAYVEGIHYICANCQVALVKAGVNHMVLGAPLEDNIGTTGSIQTAEEVSEAFFAQERTIHRLEDEIADLRAQLAAKGQGASFREIVQSIIGDGYLSETNMHRGRLALDNAAPASAQPDRGASQDGWKLVPVVVTDEMHMAVHGPLLHGIGIRQSFQDSWERALAAAPSPASQPVAPETAQGDAEFLSVRLARVARAAGVTMPEGSHDFIAGVAGTILGDIARKLESAPSDVNGATACQWPTCLSEVEQDNLADEVMRSLAGEPAVASSDAKGKADAAIAGGRIWHVKKIDDHTDDCIVDSFFTEEAAKQFCAGHPGHEYFKRT